MRIPKWIFLIMIGTYALGMLAFWLFQDRLIYQPQSAPLSECNLPKAVEFWEFQSSEITIHGIYATSQAASTDRELAVFFHGNAGRACDWRFLGPNHLGPRGYDVLVVEYPGYSGVEGTPSRAEMEKVLSALSEWYAPQDYSKTIAIGYSLGSAFASQFATHENTDALMLFAPFDRLSNVIAQNAPLLPRALLKEDYQNDIALLGYEGEITIVHGANDRVIAPERSQALIDAICAENCSPHIERIVLDDVGHVGLFMTPFFNALLDKKLP